MGTQTMTEGEFNALQFEKQLITLKDSQEAINNCCKWCLENRVHHKKIVNAWLNVLKRVKVEQRLILFYLANDVVQYSKRRNYEYVESWGTALQKATTMVRDDKVKHKILRIFKIWEQRNVYNDEFISDLCGLLSVVPSGTKNDEPHEFQPNYVVNKIKTCSKLEKDTDVKLKHLKEHNPKIHFDDNLMTSLKDRAHVDDVEKEVDVYAKHMEDYINALKLEIKNRIDLISILKQAEIQLEADRKDVKVVANAYRMFGTRVKTFQKKLDEHKQTLSSPVPSPDINAPSPTSDTDIDLPEEDVNAITSITQKTEITATYNPKAELQYAAGYYNSISTTEKENSNSFLTNGFSSFIGSEQFNLENLNSTIFNNSQANSEPEQPPKSFTPPLIHNPPRPVEAPTVTTGTSTNYYSSSHVPLLPPPMPPFSKSEMEYGNTSFNTYTTSSNTTQYDVSYLSSSLYESTSANYNTSNTSRSDSLYQDESFEPPVGANPYPPSDKYNPEEYSSEQNADWEQEPSWNDVQQASDLDTPESPPMFEKEGYSDPVEYHDNIIHSGVEDVDHRVIPSIDDEVDMEDSLGSLGIKDVDHRNLISLTGSPGNSNSASAVGDNTWSQADQDYRILPTPAPSMGDQDYRMGFNIEQLKLPPPPPPPPKSFQENSVPPPPESPEPEVSNLPNPIPTYTKSPRKSDLESMDMDMDMDLSDEDVDTRLQLKNDNLKVILDGSQEEQQFSLEPPPPLPDLPDDVDANNFLDDLTNDLHEFSNLSDELNCGNTSDSSTWNQGPLMPPPMMNFPDIGNPLTSGLPPSMNTAPPPINPMTSPPLHNLPPPLCEPLPSLSNPPPPLNEVPLNMPPMNPPPPMNPSLMPPMAMMPPPQPSNWLTKEEGRLGMEPWFPEQEHNQFVHDVEEEQLYQYGHEQNMPVPNNWMGQPPNNPNLFFRGRGNNNMRGNFIPNKRGWGRGKGVNNFRGGRGLPRGNRGNWSRGNFRGNFRGGF